MQTRAASRDLLDGAFLVVYTTLQSRGYDPEQHSILRQQLHELHEEVATAMGADDQTAIHEW
jgi:hypothetical protein